MIKTSIPLLLFFVAKDVSASVEISQFNHVDDLVWNRPDSETSCVSFREDDWVGQVYSNECENINLVSGATISTAQNYGNGLIDENRAFYLDWTGSSWGQTDSEMFWELSSGSKYSSTDPIDISFEVNNGQNYTISIILQDQDNAFIKGLSNTYHMML